MEEPAPVEQAAPVEAAPPAEEPAVEVFSDLPRRSVAVIGSECHPFVKTGGLKDTVEPYHTFSGEGNGFTFDRYESGLLLDAINRAKTLYFTNRYHWDEVVQRDMAKDVSWENSAKQYKDLYLELTQW